MEETLLKIVDYMKNKGKIIKIKDLTHQTHIKHFLKKLDIVVENENEIRVNGVLFNIKNTNCIISIYKKCSSYYDEVTYSKVSSFKYIITIGDEKNKIEYLIKNEDIPYIDGLIDNFEYEISDFKEKKMDVIEKIQEIQSGNKYSYEEKIKLLKEMQRKTEEDDKKGE